MDAGRFEALVRSLTVTPSRRDAVRLLTGAALGHLFVLETVTIDAKKGRNGQGKRNGKRKSKSKNKRNNRNGQETITLCHFGETITVSGSATQAHLDHGDTEGECQPATPPPGPPPDEELVEAKPICPADGSAVNCPTCHEARYGPDGIGDGGCCTPGGRPRDCAACIEANQAFCGTGEESPLQSQNGTCVTATCKVTWNGSLRCDYDANHVQCQTADATKPFCCRRYRSTEFGHCVADRAACGAD